eukprot:scaffold7095_cov386-Prasinococcus_capsulatus_cf.AAC.7
MTYFQIYGLLFALQVRWPTVWETLNGGGGGEVLLNVIPSVNPELLLGPDGHKALKHFFFICYLLAPLLLVVIYNYQFSPPQWLEKRVVKWTTYSVRALLRRPDSQHIPPAHDPGVLCVGGADEETALLASDHRDVLTNIADHAAEF